MENTFESVAYIRKLNSQELGYRNGEPGGAGRYFLISKGAIGFFPPLSEHIVNDKVILDVIPPFSDETVLTKFVYHNDKLSGDGTRDEYRLYLNVNNDPDRVYFKPEDIVVVLKILSKEENSFTYKLLRFEPDSREHADLGRLLEARALNPQQTHALVPLTEVASLDAMRGVSVGRKVIPENIIEEAFDEPVTHAPVTEEDRYDTTRIMRSRSFRDLIMYFYEGKCAITGVELLVDYRSFSNLEAAHIFARAAGGGNHPSNGIALERNLHWAFDKGFFTLTENYEIEVHPEAMGIPYLNDKHGKELFVPQDDRSRPNLDSIRWHRANVFGLFLRSEA